MSAAAKDKAAEQQWLIEQAHTVHDEHDAATDADKLPPLWPVLLGFAALLVVVCGFIGWALPIIADKVIP